MAKDNVFWLGKDALTKDVGIRGTTGRGKSRFKENVAQNISRTLNISLEEALHKLEPTKEELRIKDQEMSMEQNERLQRKHQKLNAVKEAYWVNSDIDDFYTISDTCASVLDVLPSDKQVKAIYDMLPEEIVFMGMQYDFDDTECRDAIYRFFEDNERSIKTALDENA